MNSLFDSAPDFDQPLAILKHCHDRIRKQLSTLERLVSHLNDTGVDEEAQRAAKAVLRYFRKAAPLHHEDEEVDLLPELAATAKGDDAVLLQELTLQILLHHRQMEIHWKGLESQLQAIEDGEGGDLSASDVEEFSELYQAHMAIEEGHIAPMALRLFDATQMKKLGTAMQTRRGIVPTAEPA
ncbi:MULTISPECIES: hemerythrin domain-containing protein [unclassified Undibacterium]|uniref:hemerythrin domain-containing protein n=1 Tax=unclassified Undibacterium TaxID=2630295 RepID=UPI002AC9278F|nr:MULTISPECIES: hemerythrin domain-containing protein [unclassified Undibacterium]MEB0140290.1 hemerythrin domain-containing protein [Undibacterium sp. CCC2.1]MEB0173296.1 hemerythrin domain-containing protein [Undibacterium sp. CCC1.1]MEB0177115.1 hemerythrin domain-containing protein [Undibacterium sp. CCC3.4]MEB0216429.1 hemerythrin domain-containing protein [Undibacterium sp. 5I2]WPX45517.1 hemerythrin domain-containing protein [Undibacterium sp. CCC3.4]